MLFSLVFMDVYSDEWDGILFVLLGFPACWAVFVIIPFMWSTQGRNLYVATILYLLFLVLAFVTIHPILVFTGPSVIISILVIIGIIIAAVQPFLLRISDSILKGRDERRAREQRRRESDYMGSE